MQDRNDIETLLVSYILHELNEEEEKAIVLAIHADPALQDAVDKLKKVFRLVAIKENTDAIDVQQERIRLENTWQIQQAASAGNEKLFAATEQPTDRKPARLIWYARAAAVAASVLLVMGLGWRLLHPAATAELPVTVTPIDNKNQLKVFTRYETNVSGVNRRFMLNDGTEVVLADQSMITFSEPFTGGKRNIYLKGKAGFTVAKDKTRPFTVYSDGISTTALGTIFTVISYEKEQRITVRLEEGKVLVQSAGTNKRKLDSPYYLEPGEELVYNKLKAVARVGHFKNDALALGAKTRERIVDDNPSLPSDNQGPWFMFNNQSLPQIFEQLELIYGVQIVYNKKDVAKLYFIGKFDKTDSVEYILKNIVNLNNLTLTKQDNRYTIFK